MSALLERMIQRTRAPLSVVEPRSRPRFASSSSLFDARESAVQPVALPEAPAPGLGPAQPSARRARPDDDSPGRASTGSAQEVEQRLPAARRSVRRTASGHPSKPQNDDDFAAASEVTGPPPQPSAGRSASTGDRSATLTPAAVSGRPTADRLEPLPADTPPGERTAVPLWRADHLLARPLDSDDERRAPGPREHERATRGEPQPKVTISIGHIEVRAAPAGPPAPSPTPFRPQVSLAAFLDGKAGRG